MNIVVVTEYLRAKPWATGRWACAIADGLARRGHSVTVLCDGTETRAPFGDVQIIERSPLRRHTQRQPMRFARWVRREIDARSPDAAISCVRTVPTEHWFPVGLRVFDEFDDLRQKRSPISLGVSLAHQAWLPLAWIAEHRARSSRHVTRCPTDIGFASTLGRDDDADLDVRRQRMRDTLAISGLVIAVSATAPSRQDFTGLLDALESVDATLLVAGGSGHVVMRWAEAVGVAHRVRPVGPTSRMSDMLAAVDVAAVPSTREGTARFATDAVRVGRPVVCAPSCVSARLADVCGEALQLCEGNWAEAITCSLGPVRTAAARSAGLRVGFDAWMDRFERELLDASA